MKAQTLKPREAKLKTRQKNENAVICEQNDHNLGHKAVKQS